MSRLWRQDRAEAAASLGSFVIQRSQGDFRPWASGDGAPPPGNDTGFGVEDEMERRVAEAYAQGLADGRATVEAELAAERDAVARLAEALPNLKPEPTMPLAMLLAETVDRLVREIVGEVEVDGLTLLARAKAAAALIGEETEPARLRVHPADAGSLAAADLEIGVETDASLARGTILVETARGWIEDGPAVRLERLRAQLDQVAAAR